MAIEGLGGGAKWAGGRNGEGTIAIETEAAAQGLTSTCRPHAALEAIDGPARDGRGQEAGLRRNGGGGEGGGLQKGEDEGSSSRSRVEGGVQALFKAIGE